MDERPSPQEIEWARWLERVTPDGSPIASPLGLVYRINKSKRTLMLENAYLLRYRPDLERLHMKTRLQFMEVGYTVYKRDESLDITEEEAA